MLKVNFRVYSYIECMSSRYPVMCTGLAARRRKVKKIVPFLVAAAVGAGFVNAAQAHVTVGIGIGVPAYPVYAAPPPVYYAPPPAPVIYAQPPVYIPPPVVYAQPPVVVGGYYGRPYYGGGYGYGYRGGYGYGYGGGWRH
jgi:hypothetical protein